MIRAEIPGIDNEDDIDVAVTGGKLTVSGTRESKSETVEEGSFRSGFHYGSFSRTVAVPQGIEAEDVTATYTNGVVEVRVKVNGDAEQPAALHPSTGGSGLA